VEGAEPRVPSNEGQPWPLGPAQAVPAQALRPAPGRRRRSAIVAGGALVALSSVVVSVGLFVPGFAALALGALLLLLPPRTRLGRERRSPLRIFGARLSAGVRAILASAARALRSAARGSAAVGRLAGGRGREGVRRVAGASARGSAAVAFAMWTGAGIAGRGMAAGSRELADAFDSASSAAWARSRPWLERAWAAALAGSVRGRRELDALATTASERLSAMIDPGQAFGPISSGPPRRAPRHVGRPREPIPRGRPARQYRRSRGER
jgi:hypothetical protein